MKKLVSILLSVLLILPVIASFGVSAESTYEELWAEKVLYEDANYVGQGASDGFVDSEYGFWPTVLLYSAKADQFTFEIQYVGFGGSSVISGWQYVWGFNEYKNNKQKVLCCLQLDDGGSDGGYDLRKVVRSLGLTKDEVVAAFQKMNEDPESIRDMLSILPDDEFEKLMSFIRDNHYLGQMPPNFVLEALTIENETWAKSLLSVSGAVYLPEYDKIYSTFELFGDAADTYKADFDGFFDGVDLTTREFQHYFKNLKRYVYEERPSYDEFMFGTVLPKIAFLETEMAKQFAVNQENEQEPQLPAKSTGDASVTSVIVLTLALPTLGVVVLAKKKRKL